MPNRGTTLLVILQAWILPCSHGFTYTPFGPGSNWGGTGSARQSFTATQPRPLNADAAAVSGGTPLGQRMVGGGGENLDPSPDEPADVDNNPFGAPGPYRDEHTAGGSRFKELLARANGQGAPRPPPPPTAKPRRVLPPEGAPNYDDDSQWEEQAIGSPDVPDPPLRQEMPGLDLGPELGLQEEGEPGISGGSRFSRMMNQARQNDDRQEAGMAPRASPRSPQEVAKRAAQPAPVSKEEKERAIRAAVERQQKMMAKARGIDLDDPTLEGAELARKKALSRAQAESQAGGYVPSSSAADDYLNALKVDSQRKQAETQARLRGKPPPPRDAPLLSAPSTAPIEDSADEKPPALPSAQEFEPVRPQKRTQATWSIQNKADAYIASLKGIKVDLPEENPFLKKQQSLEELPPQRLPRPPPPPPAPPLGPKMTYAERLRLAKQAKAAGSVATAAAPDAPPSASVTAAAAPVASPLVATEVPPPAPPSLGGSEEPKQAQENKAVVDAPPPRSALEQDIPEVALMGEDAAQAKMMRVMDLLTEHKTAGLVGEERVSELRSSLIDTREILRAETYGSSGGGRAMASPAAPPPAPLSRSPSPPPAQPQPQQQEQQQQPPAPATSPAPAAPAAPPAPPTAISPESAGTLRRCSALLQAHVHSSLAGQDLQALVEGLTSSLAIVTGQLVTQIAAGSGGSDSSSQPAGGSAPAGLEPAAAAGDGEVPAYVGGIQSVGGVLSDMGVGERPASFLPEEERSGGAEEGGTAGWTGGSLGEEDKAVATKALGYLLKHRGGKGYGRGRVSGKEAEAMVAALAEVTEIMQDEMVEE